MKLNDKSRVQKLEHALAAIGAGLLFITCLALWGMADTAAHQSMADHANAVARCKSIEGAVWGDGACYYDGIKLNFKEGYDAPAED